MKVEQLMTRDPLTVTPDTTLKDVAAILSSQGISGLPVVDGDRRVVGVVSEADILRKEQGLGGGHGSVFGWLDRGAPDPKLEARTAGEAMTSPPLTIEPGRPISVANGEVSLSGKVETRTQAELVEAYVRRVPGVVDVHSELEWSVDDLARRAGGQLPGRL
jgi:CBS-domain-containing membrane protein